jgi:hypothetical protein
MGTGARTGARARAPAGFEGIPRALGGSGCPLTASVTRTNFSGLPKCLQSSKNDAPYIVTYSPHCPCDAPCPHPALSFSGSARKIPCFLCVLSTLVAGKLTQKGALGRNCGWNVDEVLTRCGVGDGVQNGRVWSTRGRSGSGRAIPRRNGDGLRGAL